MKSEGAEQGSAPRERALVSDRCESSRQCSSEPSGGRTGE
jgi:hypothetical protein